MKSHILPMGEDSSRYLNVIGQGVAITRHADLLGWLQGDMQHYLPHDILLAGWGDFEQGSIQHDIVSALPGARSYSAGTEGLPFLLGKFHDCWVDAGRHPCSPAFREFDYLLGSDSLPGTFNNTLGAMRSVLIHGLSDERGRHDCLYVLLSAEEIPREPGATAIKGLMPYIDTVLRQLSHMPQQQQQQQPSPLSRIPPAEACGLSERETQIMAWVAMGKTNSEIGTILNISGFTVKNHMQRIFQKLNVFNRAQAVSKVGRVTLHG